MFARLFAVLIVVAVAPVAFAAGEENPYNKAKVGDFATYKVTTKVGGTTLEGTITQAISAKTDKEATIKITGTMNGMEIPAQEQKIDLTKPFDPTKATMPAGTEAKVEKLKNGKEKVKAAGKEYETKWETFKVKAKANGMDLDADVKTWTSKELPLLVVKMTMAAEVAGMKVEMEMQLSESGHKSD